MKACAEALMAKYNSAPGATLKAATPGGMWNTEAPPFEKEADKKAYVVFTFISIDHDEDFTSTSEDPLIQFSIVSFERKAEEVENIYDLLIALFDQCELAVTGFNHIQMRRTVSNLVRDPEEDAWQYTVDYEVMLQKQ